MQKTKESIGRRAAKIFAVGLAFKFVIGAVAYLLIANVHQVATTAL